MSDKKEKQKRRAARKQEAQKAAARTSCAPQTLLDGRREQSPKQARDAPIPPALVPTTPASSGTKTALASHSLAIAIEPAVVLYVMEFFERGGPAAWEVEAARAFGHTLASQGDTLLYRSKHSGKTTDLFDGLAKSVAVLAHAPGGVPLFGKCLDAERIVAGFVGAPAAKAYINESVQWYYREVVTLIQAAVLRAPATPLYTCNVIRWFELASDADLLQIGAEGYTNRAPDGTLKVDGEGAQVLAFVLERVEREVKWRLAQPLRIEEERQGLAQAQQLLQARDQGHPIECRINPAQASAWLVVFKHALFLQMEVSRRSSGTLT